MPNQQSPQDVQRARRNRVLAWLHVGLVVAVLAGFVLNTVIK